MIYILVMTRWRIGLTLCSADAGGCPVQSRPKELSTSFFPRFDGQASVPSHLEVPAAPPRRQESSVQRSLPRDSRCNVPRTEQRPPPYSRLAQLHSRHPYRSSSRLVDSLSTRPTKVCLSTEGRTSLTAMTTSKKTSSRAAAGHSRKTRHSIHQRTLRRCRTVVHCVRTTWRTRAALVQMRVLRRTAARCIARTVVWLTVSGKDLPWVRLKATGFTECTICRLLASAG